MVQRQRRLVVASKYRILELDQDDVWSDLSTLTGAKDVIINHPRLFRSLRNNDPDYGYCVAEVIQQLIDVRAENLDIILDYLRLPNWMKENDPTEYAKLFGHSQLLIDDLRNRTIANSFELNQHILRIQDVIDSDPELAIGSMRELLESVVKTVLIENGKTFTSKEKFPQLLKRAQKLLNLDPSDLDENVKGRDKVMRVLNSIGQVAEGINELRNAYGSGHGRTRQSGVTPRHARLVVNAGAALAVFLIETFEHHQKIGN